MKEIPDSCLVEAYGKNYTEQPLFLKSPPAVVEYDIVGNGGRDDSVAPRNISFTQLFSQSGHGVFGRPVLRCSVTPGVLVRVGTEGEGVLVYPTYLHFVASGLLGCVDAH